MSVHLTPDDLGQVAEQVHGGYMRAQLTPGAIFDTAFESGCEVITEPDEQGNFDAYDSEHVECSFSVVMVSSIVPVSA